MRNGMHIPVFHRSVGKKSQVEVEGYILILSAQAFAIFVLSVSLREQIQ